MKVATYQKTAIVAVFLAISFNANSGANLTNMQTFFNEVGGYGNIQGAKAFRGQTRNYYSGGSAKIRFPVRSYQIATFDPPSKPTASCSGIDAYAGAFSHINSKELVQMLKDIANNAEGALFSLALESISPALNATQKFFKTVADRVNTLNINSCQAAKGIISAGKDVINSKSLQVETASQGQGNNGLGSDWNNMIDAWKDPTKDPAGDVTTNAANDNTLDETTKKSLTGVNILYTALAKVSNSDSTPITNKEKKFLQALLGSVIVRPTKNSNTNKTEMDYVPVPAIINPKEAIAALLDDSVTKVDFYNCNSYTVNGISQPPYKCLDVTRSPTPLDFTSLKGAIQTKILAIRDKVLARNGGVTAADKEAMGISSLPLWNMIEAEYRSGDLALIDTNIDAISLIYIEGLLSRVINIATQSMANMELFKNTAIANAATDYRKEIAIIAKGFSDVVAKERTKITNAYTAKEMIRLQAERVRQQTGQRLMDAKNAANLK